MFPRNRQKACIRKKDFALSSEAIGPDANDASTPPCTKPTTDSGSPQRVQSREIGTLPGHIGDGHIGDTILFSRRSSE